MKSLIQSIRSGFARGACLALVAMTNWSALKAATLPSGYTELEYIQATGTQYLNTHITGQRNMKFEFQFTVDSGTSANTYPCILGSGKNHSSVQRAGIIVSATHIELMAGLEYFTDVETGYVAKLGKKYEIVGVINGEGLGESLTINGVKRTIIAKDEGYRIDPQGNELSMYVFARHLEGIQVAKDQKAGNRLAGKLYYLNIYTNKTIAARKYVPCQRNSDGVVGLYDFVTDTFEINASTASFIAGPNKTHVHQWGDWVKTSSPNCTAAGTVERVCSSCHESETSDIPALQHIWDSGEVTTVPGVTTEGVRTYKCTRSGCSATKKETIIPTGTVPSGYTRLEYVESKGKSWFDTGVSVRSVKYFDVTATFAITDTRYNWYTDPTSGDTYMFYSRNTADILNTSWLLGAATRVDYSNGSKGSEMWNPIGWNLCWIQPRVGKGASHAELHPKQNKKYTFRNFNDGKGSYLAVIKRGMFFVDGAEVFERYSEAGYGTFDGTGLDRNIYVFGANLNGNPSQLCCARIYALWIKGKETSAKDVNMTYKFIGIPCKRNSDGAVGMYDAIQQKFFCPNSDTPALIAGKEVGPECNHTAVSYPTVNATCEEDGYTGGTYCSKCQATLTARTRVPALGHKVTNWTTTKNVSCTEDGIKTGKCENCQKTQTEIIKSTGHDWSGWTVTKEPTEETTGLKERSCSKCHTVETVVIPVIGSRVPAYYTELESLTSSGNGYIDSKVSVKSGLTFEMDLSAKYSSSANTHMWSAYASGAEAYVVGISKDNHYLVGFGSSDANRLTAGSPATRQVVTVSYTTGKFSVTAGGASLAKDKSTAGTPTTASLYFFARHNGSSADNKGVGTIYSAKVYENGVVTHEFVPCKNDKDQLGFWDINAQVFCPVVGDITGGDPVTPTPTKPTEVKIPTAVQGLVFTGSAQTGVAAGTGYTVKDGTKTEAGNYTAVCSLTDKTKYVWSDGTTTDKSIAWSIAEVTPPSPPEDEGGDYTWKGTGSTVWANAANWTGVSGGTYPQKSTDSATIPSSLTADTTIDLAGASYALTALAAADGLNANLTLKNGSISVTDASYLKVNAAKALTFENMTISSSVVATDPSNEYKKGSFDPYVAGAKIVFKGANTISGMWLRNYKSGIGYVFQEGVTEVKKGFSFGGTVNPFTLTIDRARFVTSDFVLPNGSVAISIAPSALHTTGNAAWTLSGTFAPTAASTLTVDAAGLTAGTYTLIAAKTFTDNAAFATKASVENLADGQEAAFTLANNTLSFVITASGTPEPPPVVEETPQAGLHVWTTGDGDWTNKSAWTTKPEDGCWPDHAGALVRIDSSATIDLKGGSFRFAAMTNKGAAVTFKNGTLTQAKGLIQSEAASLTFENMTLVNESATASAYSDHAIRPYVDEAAITFVGDNTVRGYLLRTSNNNNTFAFKDGATSFDQGFNFGASARTAALKIDNATVSFGGSLPTELYTLNIALSFGAKNSGATPLLSFGGSFAPYSRSTLTVDATGLVEGTYTLIAAGTFTDNAAFATKTVVENVPSGLTATVALADNKLTLTLAAGSGAPVIDPEKGTMTAQVEAASGAAACEQAKNNLKVPTGVEASTYRSYFKLDATEVSTGVYSVSATLDEVKIGLDDSVKTLAEGLVVGAAGTASTTIAAKPGLYYAVKKSESLKSLESVKIEDWRLAKQSTLELDTSLPATAKSGFFKVVVSPTNGEK